MNAGELMTPNLRLSRVLGQGGMGSVWAADHLALGTQVAVKFMAAKFNADADLVERFRREAMAAAQIRSPHVAQVFDHGMAEGGVLYIVMELLEGEDLRRRVKRLGPLPPDEVARIVAQTAKALGRAHRLGIIHRDIKPTNIFLIDVEGEPFVKVFDFGVAKSLQQADLHMTTTGNVIGTPLYMSPEQLHSAKSVDFRADLWSLAVSAYFALTGHLPFIGENFAAVSAAIRQGVFKPPSEIRPGLPPEIDAWMEKALARAPAERFESAREFAEALWVAAGEIARAPLASVSEIAVVEPALPAVGTLPLLPLLPAAAQVPSTRTRARLTLMSYLRRQLTVHVEAAADGAIPGQSPTLAALSSTGLGAGRRRAPLVIITVVLIGLSGVIVSLLVDRWRASTESVAATSTPSSAVPLESAIASALPAPTAMTSPAPSATSPAPASPLALPPAAAAGPSASASTAPVTKPPSKLRNTNKSEYGF